jgi:hypothetical protein
MGEGLSKVNKLNVTFDNPSLFPFHAFRENKRIYNYFFNKYVFSQQKVYRQESLSLPTHSNIQTAIASALYSNKYGKTK